MTTSQPTIVQTDQANFPPTPDQVITIEGDGREFSAPWNMLDLTVGVLIEQGLSRSLAFAIVAVRLKLYAHKRADLGYGLVVRIRDAA